MILSWNTDEGWKYTQTMRSTCQTQRRRICFRNRLEHRWSQTMIGDFGRILIYTQKVWERQTECVYSIANVICHIISSWSAFLSSLIGDLSLFLTCFQNCQSRIILNMHCMAKSSVIVSQNCVWMGVNPFIHILTSIGKPSRRVEAVRGDKLFKDKSF